VEVIFKIAVTGVVLCLVYYQLVFLRGLWRSQVDPQATVARLLEKLKPESDVIATRDPSKIYQGGKAVGEVIGEVTQDGTRFLFKQLANTTALQRDQLFEYRRQRFRIVSIGSRTGMLVNMTDSGTETATDVLGDVVCEIAGR